MINLLRWASQQNCTEYFRVIACFAFAAELLDGLQCLSLRQEYHPSGLYSWRSRRASHRLIDQGPLGIVLGSLFSYYGVILTCLLQIVCTLDALWHVISAKYAIECFLLLVIRLGTHLRDGEFGKDGSSQMQTVLLTGLLINAASSGTLAKSVGLWFIGLNCLIAYVTSGAIKVQFSNWRNGTALQDALSTEVVGNRTLWHTLAGRRYLAACLSWAVILFESVLPLLAIADPLLCVIFLLCGITFHLFVSGTMGLNSFLFTFLGTYPAILWVSFDIHRMMIPLKAISL